MKAKLVVRFIENNIICQYGVPQEIILDNGPHFKGEVCKIMESYNIEHHNSSPYRLQTNGAVEADNKNIKNILAKMVVTYKDWAKNLPFALWGYRTSISASTRATPYSLVYGSETVLPIEVEIQSLKVLVETKDLEEDWVKTRYEQLALIDEKRARVQYYAQGYQKRITREFNKKVKPRRITRITDYMLGGAIRITDLDGDEMLCPITMDRIRRYNVLKEKKRKERKRKEKKTKGWPRQKLRQKDPAGLKPERVV